MLNRGARPTMRHERTAGSSNDGCRAPVGRQDPGAAGAVLQPVPVWRAQHSDSDCRTALRACLPRRCAGRATRSRPGASATRGSPYRCRRAAGRLRHRSEPATRRGTAGDDRSQPFGRGCRLGHGARREAPADAAFAGQSPVAQRSRPRAAAHSRHGRNLAPTARQGRTRCVDRGHLYSLSHRSRPRA